MIDYVGHEVNVGDKVKILECKDFPNFVGKIVTVMVPDAPNKIRVSFSDQWQGYFKFNEIIKIQENNNCRSEKEIMELMAFKPNIIYHILKNPDHIDRSTTIKCIKKQFPSTKERFHYLSNLENDLKFTSEEWFWFGVIFQAN